MQLTYSFAETWVHRTNPSLKLTLGIALFFLVLFSGNINFLMYLTIGSAVLFYGYNGHPGRVVLWLSVPFLLLFLSSSTSMILFGKGETTWFHWGIVHITEEGFIRGVHVGFKSLNFAWVGLLMALTTRPIWLFYSLMQQCRLPAKFAYSFMAAIRLIPMMAEELQTLRYALKVRGVEQQRGVTAFVRRVKAYSIPLLAQSIRKAQRIAVAMEAKRFSQVQKRTYYYVIGFSRWDIVLLLVWAFIIVSAYLLGKHVPLIEINRV